MVQLRFLLLGLCILPTLLLAQQRSTNYRIHISEIPFVIEGSLENNWNALIEDSTVYYKNAVYALLQFDVIPTEEAKAQLLEAGITLISYVPNFAWISEINPSLTPQDLIQLDVRNITKIQSEWKTSTALRTGKIPSYAGSKSMVTARLLFQKNSDSSDWNPIIDRLGLNVIETNGDRHWMLVESALSQLIAFAEHPLVHYIELGDAPVENEGILDESERSISTYISRNPGKNYFFDGTGVKIGVDEGGIVDTLQNPNFRSRIDRSDESGTSVSGHKTGVSTRMAGAGNLDPTEEGTAFGAELYSGGLDNYQAATDGITIINRSYGWGCSSSSETYNSSSETYDNAIRTNPSFIISHSAGNAGSSECYAGSMGWGNITGLPKMAKNIFAVGASGSDGTLTGFSSRGPAKDGRILPNIVAPGGGGTSHASPNLSGVYGQLNQAYRFHNGGAIPNSGLLKAILLNAADDMLNPGPDFKTGYGHVNARRAYEVIRQNQFETGTAIQGSTNVHSITVPANVKEIKVMVYWVDWEATPGIVTRALVNDLDMVLQDPNAVDYYPWVLNPTFDSISLNDPAVRAVDTLNNAEQVTIANPVSGTYQVSVTGSIVPQGPQPYFVTYDFIFDELFVTHPHGGEKLVPGETERIRWDACDSTLSFDLSYSLDNGSSWNLIATGVSPDSRYLDWTVPAAITKNALIKVTRGQTIGESDTTFSILDQPTNLELVWSCADSSLFLWDPFPNADGYVVYRIVGDYMDSVAYTSSNSIILNGLSLSEMEYVSIAAVQNGVTGRRILALERPPSALNCVQNNVGSLEIVQPGIDFLPSCMAGANSTLSLIVRNWGVNAVGTIPVAYRLNGGAIYYDTIFSNLASGADYELTFATPPNFTLGLNNLEVWTAFPSDSDLTNDTIAATVKVYSSTSSNPNISENFDTFSTCSTAWDCELVSCAMQNGWYNPPNGQADDIDWRTHSGATGTANTGPSTDHTSGTGNYLYLETSGPCVYSTARLHSPCFDLAGINSAELSFWYHAYGSSIGSLHVDAIADGEFFEDITTPVVGDQGDQWTQMLVDLSAFSGKQVVVIIRGITGGSFYGDLAIDDININTGPIASFSSTQTQLCSGQNVILNNTSSYGNNYEWSFSPNTVTYIAGTNSNSIHPQVNFTNSGSYTVQLITTNTFGADTSIFVDYLNVWSGTPAIFSATDFCESDSVIVTTNNNGVAVDYLLNGVVQSTTTNGSYYYPNAANGDTLSLIYTVNNNCILSSNEVIISIGTVNAVAVQNGLQLETTTSGTQYQWIDCGNSNASISGATNAIFTPTADGEYAVIVTENNCSDTSDCLVFSTLSLEENGSSFVQIHPNPTTGILHITPENTSGELTVEVYDAIGQRVTSASFAASEPIHVTINGASGMYAVVVKDTFGQSAVIPVIKQ